MVECACVLNVIVYGKDPVCLAGYEIPKKAQTRKGVKKLFASFVLESTSLKRTSYGQYKQKSAGT